MSINPKLISGSILSGAIIILGFQNCSPASYDFKAAENLSSSGEIAAPPIPTEDNLSEPLEPEPALPVVEVPVEPELPVVETPPNPPVEEPIVDAVVENIETSCSNAELRSLKTKVRFAPPTNISGTNSACAWNKFGNLGTKDRYVRARGEQIVNLDIPSDAHVCKMNFNFPSQEFRYDDQILLTYRGVVLATSMGHFLKVFDQKEGVAIYDWSKLVDTNGYVAEHATYCAGQESGLASCVIPKTQTTGKIDLNIDPRVFYNIAEQRAGTSHSFSLVTTGDNDIDKDCKHAGFSFDVEIQYYQPQTR